MTVTIPLTQQKGASLRKSKSGCQECRLRKVKCDEIKPVCSNCRRRFLNIETCSWTTSKSIHQKRSHLTTQKEHAVPSITSLDLHPPSLSATTSQSSTLDLRLMYHYTATVRHSLPGCPGAPAHAWSYTIPQLSFSSPLILHPMLALSALHLHSSHQSDSQTLAIALRKYLHQALILHRHALQQSIPHPQPNSDRHKSKSIAENEDAAEQLWLSGVLLSHIYGLLSRERHPNEAYALPIQAFKVLEGVGALFSDEKRRESLRGKGYEFIGYEPLPPVLPLSELAESSRTGLQEVEDDLEGLMEGFGVYKLDDSGGNERKDVYVKVKEYVYHLYHAYYSGTDATTIQRFIAGMVVRCGSGYRELLDERDVLAMVLLARGMVLLRGLEWAWWVDGEGAFEVVERDLRGIEWLIESKKDGGERERGKRAMEWPLGVLEGRVLLCRDL